MKPATLISNPRVGVMLLDFGPLPWVTTGAVVGGLIGATIDRRLRIRRRVRQLKKLIIEKRNRERGPLNPKPATDDSKSGY
jgi:hypothetical protein